MTWTPGSLPADQDPSLAAAPRVVFPPMPAPAMATAAARRATTYAALPTDADALAARARCDASARKRSPRWDLFRNARGADAFKNLYPGCNAADDFASIHHGVLDALASRPHHLFDALIPTPRSKVRRAWAMLKTLTRKGVPHDLRPHVWWHASAAFVERGDVVYYRDESLQRRRRPPARRRARGNAWGEENARTDRPGRRADVPGEPGVHGREARAARDAAHSHRAREAEGRDGVLPGDELHRRRQRRTARRATYRRRRSGPSSTLLQNVVADRVHSHDIGGCVRRVQGAASAHPALAGSEVAKHFVTRDGPRHGRRAVRSSASDVGRRPLDPAGCRRRARWTKLRRASQAAPSASHSVNGVPSTSPPVVEYSAGTMRVPASARTTATSVGGARSGMHSPPTISGLQRGRPNGFTDRHFAAGRVAQPHDLHAVVGLHWVVGGEEHGERAGCGPF